ncbi:ABC transporter substrate-binding protein [Actinoalloteichus spitiensis]|uniref:ABC transporter substrate-binding protein n=1 Tax=Actinoalloteichus spitiensis TaxID=252394 RepID=UPI0003735281|nr:ABC transporter substrate-binding protein [Actinoalloteichus spitiensis]
MTNPVRRGPLLGTVSLAVVLLAGCASTADEPAPAASSAPSGAAASYPRTVGGGDQGEQVTIPAEPSRIAALSPDAAEAALALVGAERLVAVPASVTGAHLGNHVEEAVAVSEHLPPGNNPDPELVLSLNPDLVLVTPRHDGEQDALSLLEETGVPVLVLEHWNDLDEVAGNLSLLGEALGVEDRAESLVADMAARREALREAVDGVDRPAVLALSNQAGVPFALGPDSFTTGLVELAGGASAAERAGVRRTGPVDPEVVVGAAPDAVVLVDVTGAGRESFDSLLAHPAVADLPAIREDRVLLLPAASAFASGIAHALDGLEELAGWLHPERFDGR